jgi:glycosyltransferase involved in cell wall biosynthesis
MKKKAIVFGSYSNSLINFRKNLLMDLVARGYEVIAMAPEHDVEVIEQLHKIGVDFKQISLSRTGINILKDCKSLFGLIKLFKKHKPNLLITYTIKPVVYGNLIARFFSNIKTVSLITGLGYLETENETIKKAVLKKLIFILYKFSLKKLNYIAFQNSDDEQYFRKNRLVNFKHTQSTITAGSGVDLDYFKPMINSTSQISFLFIARLIKAKGILNFLEAAEFLKKKYNDSVVFEVVGLPDPENPDSISEHEIERAIKMGVRPIIANCSVFVLPTYYREGTPRTILEAMAMSKAIVTTNTPGCKETVIPEYNGYFVSIKNTNSLIDTLEKFIHQPSIIAIMGDNSLKIAKDKYEVKIVNKKLLNFIQA